MEIKGRVDVLDTLRVVAIVMVILSHYYLNYPNIGRQVSWGALGVPLFFVISGFVINSSLDKTRDYKEFIFKRFLRLSPAMLICSTITFSFFRFVYEGEGYESSKSFVNYIWANLLIDPNFINIFCGELKYYYIDNAYWSLWVEIIFYALIGFLYFIDKNRFILYYILVSIIGMPIFYLMFSSIGANILQTYWGISEETTVKLHFIARGFPFFQSAFWFLKGIFLYQLYHNKQKIKYVLYILICFIINMTLDKYTNSIIVFSVLLFSFMMFLVYYPEKIKYMSNAILSKIGIASYSMYLIHYHLGMVMVKYLNEKVAYSYIWPFMVLVLVIAFGLFSYKYLERPLRKLYEKKIKI